jgi:hypothetical protein
MDDDQVIRSTEPSARKGSNVNILVAGILLVLVLLLAAAAYYIGKNSNSQSISTISPTPFPFPTESVSSPTAKPTSASVSANLSPSKAPNTTPTPIEKTKILDSVSGLDGFRSSNDGGNNTLDIRAGRNSNLVTRGFVTFTVVGIPVNAQIKSATLRLYQSKVTGNPYSVGGQLKIDHLTYGNSLDSTDYGLPALTSNAQTLSNSETIEWKEADVTTEFKNDIANGRSTAQYRIHFSSESSGGTTTGDFVYFDSSNSYA